MVYCHDDTIMKISILESSAPLRGSSFQLLRRAAAFGCIKRPKGDFEGLTDEQTTGLRELDLQTSALIICCLIKCVPYCLRLQTVTLDRLFKLFSKCTHYTTVSTQYIRCVQFRLPTINTTVYSSSPSSIKFDPIQKFLRNCTSSPLFPTKKITI